MADATSICAAEGCGRPKYCREMCTMHYQRLKRYGSTHDRRRTPRPCAADGCALPAEKRDWCNRHYRRVLHHGATESPYRPQPDRAWLNSIVVPSGSRAVPVLINVDQGFTYALVDEDDYAAVARWRWRLSRGGYAHRAVHDGGKSRWLYMHRSIMGSPAGLEIDHINRTKLDNRRCNLRPADRSLNSFNQSPNRRDTSGHRGVGYFKPAKLWRAYITHKSQNKRIELGYFKTKEEAIAARKAAEERYFGECA